MCRTLKEVLFRVVLVYLTSIVTCCISLYSGDHCKLEGGVCTAVQTCTEYRDEIRRDGISAALAAKLRRLNCGYEGRTPLVCCKSNIPTRDTSIITKEPVGGDSGNRFSIPRHRGEHRNLKLLPTLNNCGDSDDFRITNGKVAALNAYPWMVMLIYLHPADGESTHECGGSLINDRYVLTAAHCIVFSSERYLHHVVLGEHNITTDPDCDPESPNLCFYSKKMTIIRDDVTVHENYFAKDMTHANDIALIRLPEPADVSLANIQPVCLPTTVELRNQYLEDSCAVVTGWGVFETTHNKQSSVLLFANLPIINNEMCMNNLYKNMRQILDSQMCTSINGSNVQCSGASKDIDSCNGDSGGPLVFNERSSGMARMVQWGIVSFGLKQCATGFPTVYTRVSHYMDWILDNIRE